MKKRLLSFTLLFLFIFTIPSFAQNTNQVEANKDEVLRLKKVFNISNNFDKFNFTSTNVEKNLFYSYSWSNNKGENINIITDKNNNIISYDKYLNLEENKALIKNKDEIENIIKDYLNKIDSNLLKEYSLDDFDINFKNNYARFTYNRKVNDIFVLNDYLSITIELTKGELSNFSRSIDKIVKKEDFEKTNNIINIEKAKEIFQEKENLKLSYFIKDIEKNTVLNVYSQINKNMPIDAKNGDLIIIENNIMPISLNSEKEAADESVELTPVEKEEIDKIKNLRPISDYKSYISKNFNTKGLNFSDYSLINSEDKYLYSIVYSDKENTPKIEFYFDAKDLNLISYDKFIQIEDDKDKLDEKTAMKISKDFLNKHFKNNNIDLKNPSINLYDSTTSISFNRVENNNYVINNNISIVINNKNKEISHYSVNFNNLDFNKIDDFIPEDKAHDIAFSKGDFGLYYIYNKNTPKLVYTFNENTAPILLSSNGDEIDFSGNLIKENQIIYDNIDNSKYAKEINYLKTLKIGVPGISNLKEKIKEKDFVYLVKSISSNIIYSEESIKDIYEYPAELELNKSDFNSKDNITKNNFAIKLIVNASGYKNLSNLENIFRDNLFKDQEQLSKEDKNYFAIAYGLNLYNNSLANPNIELTHEDALYYIYELLK